MECIYWLGEFMRTQEQVIKITSLIAILGVVNVPIIKFSVDWWNTLHQPASINILSNQHSNSPINVESHWSL